MLCRPYQTSSHRSSHHFSSFPCPCPSAVPVPAPGTKRLLLLSANAIGVSKSILDDALKSVVKQVGSRLTPFLSEAESAEGERLSSSTPLRIPLLQAQAAQRDARGLPDRPIPSRPVDHSNPNHYPIIHPGALPAHPAAAHATQDVVCVTFDDYEGSLATLANAARAAVKGFDADCIGVLTPCSPGADGVN